MAKMYADTLELGLFTTKRIPETESSDDWIDYTSFLLRNSPALRIVVEDHPRRWPELVQQFERQTSPGLAETAES